MNPTAVAAAKARHQVSAELHRSGVFTMAGRDYTAAIVFKPIIREINPNSGLWESKQPIRITVRKTVLPTPPARKAEVVVKGVTYIVHGELGGQNASDIAWVIHGSRKLPSPT